MTFNGDDAQWVDSEWERWRPIIDRGWVLEFKVPSSSGVARHRHQ